MDISVFEIIGPVMLGPSSSGTAGMARLGKAAHEFLDAPVKSINLRFHPRFSGYSGLKSHVALVGGILGFNESDPIIRDALEIAKGKGIDVTASWFHEPYPSDAHTIGMTITQTDGKIKVITGVSVGGGSIDIIEVDGFQLELESTAKYLFVWSGADCTDEVKAALPESGRIKISEKNGKYLLYIEVPVDMDEGKAEKIKSISSVEKILFTKPFLNFGNVPHEPLFRTFSDVIKLSEETGKDMAQLAIDYEINRSGRTRDDIFAEMKQSLLYMRETVEFGLTQPVKTLFGVGTGYDGKLVQKAVEEGRTLGGSTLGRAIAKAIATYEVGCSMNRIVAAPTGGSSGIVPACLLTVQEDRGFSDDELVNALFVAAAAGVCMYYHNASFSGAGGGCQGEVGVSSAIAAAALCYLGGGSTKACCHAMALSMKNLLGLICDPIAGFTEVPCIKRNAMGAANAFTGCDMALSGVESFVPPDEVIEALCDTQRRLPPQLRAGCGGLACTHTAQMARQLQEKLSKECTLPIKEV